MELDLWSLLFGKQKELYLKYKKIEGMPEEWPLDLNKVESQVCIKDFFWRVTEELIEANQALEGRETSKFLEELSDALHFYLELYVLLDFKPGTFVEDIYLAVSFTFLSRDYRALAYKCIINMGLASNCLQNKKWKIRRTLTDIDLFKSRLDKGLSTLIDLIVYSLTVCSGANKSTIIDDVASLYLNKNAINHSRIEKGY